MFKIVSVWWMDESLNGVVGLAFSCELVPHLQNRNAITLKSWTANTHLHKWKLVISKVLDSRIDAKYCYQDVDSRSHTPCNASDVLGLHLQPSKAVTECHVIRLMRALSFAILLKEEDFRTDLIRFMDYTVEKVYGILEKIQLISIWVIYVVKFNIITTCMLVF